MSPSLAQLSVCKPPVVGRRHSHSAHTTSGILKHLHGCKFVSINSVHFSSVQRIKFKLATLTHSLLTYTPFCITTLPHVLYALQTLTCCLFLVFALPLHPVVLVLQPPQSGTHSHLAFATLPLTILSVAFLKLTVSSRPSAPPSDSPKCLRFGHSLTLCTLNIHLFTYLLT